MTTAELKAVDGGWLNLLIAAARCATNSACRGVVTTVAGAIVRKIAD